MTIRKLREILDGFEGDTEIDVEAVYEYHEGFDYWEDRARAPLDKLAVEDGRLILRGHYG